MIRSLVLTAAVAAAGVPALASPGPPARPPAPPAVAPSPPDPTQQALQTALGRVIGAADMLGQAKIGIAEALTKLLEDNARQKAALAWWAAWCGDRPGCAA